MVDVGIDMVDESRIECRGLRPDEASLYEAMVHERGGTPIEYYLSHYDGLGGGWQNSRVVLVDGRIVSHVRLYDRIVRWGSGTIHCGGMADVYTHPQYRRRGFGRMLLKDAIERYTEWGCGLSMILSGVFEFYSSEGWERYPTYRFDVQLRRDWHRPVPGYRVRRFDRSRDLDAVAAIHEAYNRDSPLTLVRSAEYWQRHFSWCRREQEFAFYVAEHEGEIVGYSRADTQTIWEIGYLPGHAPAAEALLEAEVRLMASRGGKAFSIHLPWQEPLIAFLRTLRCTTSLVETCLLRVVDLPRLLTTLVPDMERSLREAMPPAPPVRRIAFDVAGHQASLEIDSEGRVAIHAGRQDPCETLPLTQRQFFVLATGGDEYVPLRVSKPARDLLELLFPKRNPMWWPIDTV